VLRLVAQTGPCTEHLDQSALVGDLVSGAGLMLVETLYDWTTRLSSRPPLDQTRCPAHDCFHTAYNFLDMKRPGCETLVFLP
jgi:hypothetical protein